MVGKQTGIKFTPSLAFFPDAIPENAKLVEDLLRVAAQADAQVHKQAVGATYAGESDPYRHPRVEEDEDVSDVAVEAVAEATEETS